MRFEVFFGEYTDEVWQRMIAAFGVLMGLDIIYYAFIYNQVMFMYNDASRMRIAIGLLFKWTLLSFMISIHFAGSMTNAFVWGVLVGAVVYGVINVHLLVSHPEIGMRTLVYNMIYGATSLGIAGVAALYMPSKM